MPSSIQRPTPKERVLLYSIWVLLTLGALLFVFWPRAGQRTMPAVAIQLAPELQSWFSSGLLTSFTSQNVGVELKFQKKPLDALRQVRSVHIGYDFGREREVLYRGSVVWSPSKQNAGDLQMTLPNPQGTVPKWIRLYFADSR